MRDEAVAHRWDEPLERTTFSHPFASSEILQHLSAMHDQLGLQLQPSGIHRMRSSGEDCTAAITPGIMAGGYGSMHIFNSMVSGIIANGQ